MNETVTTSNNNDALESQQANERCDQETESAGKPEWLGLMNVDRPRGICWWQRMKKGKTHEDIYQQKEGNHTDTQVQE